MASPRLRRSQYIGYGLGATGSAGFGTVPGLVLALYLTNTLGVAAGLAAIVGEAAAVALGPAVNYGR